MGCNFTPDHVWEPRNILREEAPEADKRSESEVEWEMLGTVLFRVLKRFPEAYRAVVDGLRELGPIPIPAT